MVYWKLFGQEIQNVGVQVGFCCIEQEVQYIEVDWVVDQCYGYGDDVLCEQNVCELVVCVEVFECQVVWYFVQEIVDEEQVSF